MVNSISSFVGSFKSGSSIVSSVKPHNSKSGAIVIFIYTSVAASIAMLIFVVSVTSRK